MPRLRPHPQAEIVPPHSRQEYASLRSAIARQGVLNALDVTAAGVVLDGHARLRIAQELELPELPVRVVEVEDERQYMLLAAITRRQLKPSVVAALLVELAELERKVAQGRARQRANLRQNAEVAKLPPRGRTRELAASLANVSPRTIQDALTVYQRDRALFKQIRTGRLTASAGARRLRRAEQLVKLGQPPVLPSGPFELLYIDPPWQLGNPDAPGAPENHYPTMALEQLRALELPAAERCVLCLWSVISLQPEAFELLADWGFRYESQIIWDKETIGPGVYVRNQHELLLIGFRGAPQPPDPLDRPPSVIRAKRGRHSEKPVIFAEWLERMYPSLSKLEMFARGKRRRGWSAWGNEVEQS